MKLNDSILVLKKRLRLNLKAKFLLSYLGIIALVVGAIVTVSLIMSTNILQKRTGELSGEIINQIAQNIEYKVKNIYDSANIVTRDQRITELLNGNEESRKDYPLLQMQVTAALKELALSISYINFACIKTPGNDFIVVDKKNIGISSNFLREIFNRYEYRSMESLGEPVWCNSYEKSQAFLMKTFKGPGDKAQTATILFGIDTAYLRALGNQESIIKEENIAILDKNNNNLAYGLLNMAQLMYLTKNNILYAESSNFNITYQNVDYMITYTRTPSMDWKIFCIIPRSELLNGYNVIKSAMFIVGTIGLIIGVLIASIMAFHITRNISNLDLNMRKVEDGDLSIRVRPKSYDEIGMLSLRFNYMVNKISKLIDTVSAERLAKQQAEFQVIQAKINPHFLYNTLGSIQWLARMKQQPEIENMTISLIELLKNSVNKESEFQTVGEEVAYVRNYLKLQKIRYENKFNDFYELEPGIEKYITLNFILQPLVENAIYHGLDLSEGDGSVTIRAFSKDELLIMEVIDNGVGMSEDTIQTILTKEKKTYPGLNSLGVKIVNDRVKLYFGDEYGISYESTEGAGTRATVVLPLKKQPADK